MSCDRPVGRACERRLCQSVDTKKPKTKQNQKPVKERASLLIIIITAPFFLSQLQLNRPGLITD